ncbi:hypothetical protein COO91_03992 [Nostoc flagelliforme CCNUN1]|uniref:Uncharacterized protein n=1 Tax=Nostoc flagelliforme CCNUN1 TaxID=2038116 RepID=A0A2K8STB1_9NOSO|nr:hypothetical protein COO91_03992 [Nostoc flagelliforme CCNUN1]
MDTAVLRFPLLASVLSCLGTSSYTLAIYRCGQTQPLKLE